MKFLAAIIIFLSMQVVLRGQLCNGSLGDPVVHISFGGGSNPGPALPAAITSYNYIPSSCPNDGQYSISNLTFNCFGGSWHTVSGDHTPNDASGYYMLINASFLPGDFYLDTIRNLCPNTNYEFAAWVLNLLKPSACNNDGIKPNLTFRIETLIGTVLTTYNSGDIDPDDSPKWKQYGTFFQTPSGISDVVIRLTNNAPGGCGNDIALDDITFRPCGPRVNAVISANDSSEIFACESDKRSFLLTASFSPGVYANPAFQWQSSMDGGASWSNIPGATSNSWLRPASGVGSFKYRMLIADGPSINSVSCRLASNPITITITQPDAQVTNYVFGCYGSTVALFAAGGSLYNWTGPNGFASFSQGPEIPHVKFTDAGWYKVTVTDYKGCSDADSTHLLVYPAATAFAGSDVSICEGTSTTLNATGGIRYYWYPSKGLSLDSIPDPIANPTDTTRYRVIVINQYGCYDTANVRVNVWKEPIANAGPDKKTRLGYAIPLSGSVKGTDVNYYWTPSNFLNISSTLRPFANPPQTMSYTLHVESNRGCGSHSDDMIVKVYERVLVPNAFSPNGDGINDVWIVEPLDLFDESVTEVYNRYGEIVYRSKGYATPWNGTRNGKPLPVGTYFYVIDLRVNKEPKITGSVTIVR